jgi:hypothetical protein
MAAGDHLLTLATRSVSGGMPSSVHVGIQRMMNPAYIIEFEIEGYLEMLRDPEISERMRTRLAEKLADAHGCSVSVVTRGRPESPRVTTAVGKAWWAPRATHGW